MEIISYLRSKNLQFEQVNGGDKPQARLRTCVFCGDNGNHFYINIDTGQYYCHKCAAAGSIYSLEKHLGDVAAVYSFNDIPSPNGRKKEEPSTAIEDRLVDAHNGVFTNERVVNYLMGRRFSPDAVLHFKIGYIPPDEDGVDWITYPYIIGGKLKNIKMRSIPPHKKMFRRISGGESPLFNEDVLAEQNEEIIITEGEADCVVLWSRGMHNVVGATVGAKGIINNWIDKLDKFQRIYFAYDSDIDGIQGAQKFAARLGIERCYIIKLPCKDVNQYFIDGGTREGFLELKTAAKRPDVESVKSIGGLLQESIVKLYSGGAIDENELDFPWPSVSKLTGKLKPGDMFVVAARPGVGKTTFAFNMLYGLAKNGIPCMLFELEMRPERILPRIVQLHTKIPDVNNIEVLSRAYHEMSEFPFYFAYKFDKLTFDVVADTVRMCVRRYGIKFLVFDNLHFLVRGQDQTREVSVAIRAFKMLAEDVGIPIMVVARPRKTKSTIIDSEDLKDSADIEGDSDYVLLLHRKKRKEEAQDKDVDGIFFPEMLVRVDKSRWSGGGDAWLLVDDTIAEIKEIH